MKTRRQCGYCGTFVGDTVKTCPRCREAIPEPVALLKVEHGVTELRRGLFYMLLTLIFYFFARPESPLPIPIHIPPMVTTYLLPLLFLLGLGFAIYGVMRKIGIL